MQPIIRVVTERHVKMKFRILYKNSDVIGQSQIKPPRAYAEVVNKYISSRIVTITHICLCDKETHSLSLNAVQFITSEYFIRHTRQL